MKFVNKCQLINPFQLSMKQFEKTLQVFRNACLPKSGAAVGMYSIKQKKSR